MVKVNPAVVSAHHGRTKIKLGGIHMGGGTTTMFSNITSSAIITEATTWTSQFSPMVLTAIGLGIGFACVAFAKRLFF